jgi:RNA polymerase sigma-54 factor
MKLGLGLEQRLGLELRLHPQLVLTLRLLPLTALELEGLVRHELEENPVLEEVPELPEPGEPEAPADVVPDSIADADKLISETEEGPDVGSRETYEFLDLVDSDDAPAAPQAEPGGGPDFDPMELTPDESAGIAETLMPGLRADLDEEDARIAEIVLQSVDADGFLTVSPDELSTSHGLDAGRLRSVLDRIRHIEPGGIACCDRREALLIQLEMQGHAPDSLESRLVGEFWTLLLQMQLGKIAQLCAVPIEAIHHAAESIHGLEMRPARRFAGRASDYVSPDFSVTWRDSGPHFEYNDDREPRLRIARRYVDMLRHPDRYSREQVSFARQKYNRALMLLKAIESRRTTLRKLMQVVLDQQRAFFEHGPEHLKPATLREAAGCIGVHPSTISRASMRKYVETDFGIFPLKHFFMAGASDKSRVSIKELIRQMVENEDRRDPLRDDGIEARLASEHGVRISRRTVAKYRAELGIPTRGQRGGL